MLKTILIYDIIILIEDKKLLDDIEKFIITPKISEYNLSGKFSKGPGLDGIYKILDNGEQIKIAEYNVSN
ncbi:MAG: hypothetical protein PHH06_03840 [Candidatus Gracilibacteria bacterium]|nr:hypothetical protein [Candidatus Gracilibacteria bacterium]